MTFKMYVTMANILNDAAKDDHIHVVLWHGAGDSFCAGTDLEDLKNNLPDPYYLDSQFVLINALFNFGKPLVAAVHGAAIGVGTTMLTNCDFVYAGESANFQMQYINLALVPVFGTTFSLPARLGYLRAAELILLGQSFDAKRAAELGLVTRVVSDKKLLSTATEIAQKLAEMPAGALQACKRLMKQSSHEQVEQAMKNENEELSKRFYSADAKEALNAFLEMRPPNFTRKE